MMKVEAHAHVAAVAHIAVSRPPVPNVSTTNNARSGTLPSAASIRCQGSSGNAKSAAAHAPAAAVVQRTRKCNSFMQI
jgi:hypothetical protein